ncbi:hypothetical protein [Photobacterium leiognathi]|uniref:hypothetical protein n=1 Tax=Photobacterium leiognathi TaxID=553611 RepID=UPI002981283E|nr:hypothetical protein [Photobacterium leiognathi]
MSSINKLSTDYISSTFESLINNTDTQVSDFIKQHTGKNNGGTFEVDPKGDLILSSSDSLTLQQKMAEQSIATQTATQVLKSVHDSIMASARNI